MSGLDFVGTSRSFGAVRALSVGNSLTRELSIRRTGWGEVRLLRYHSAGAGDQGRQAETLVEVWQRQYRGLGERPGADHVLIFENEGEVVSSSRPWTPRRGSPPAISRRPAGCSSRTYVAPKATRPSVADLGPSEVADFAAALSHVLVRFDNLVDHPPLRLRALPNVHYSKAERTLA